MFGLSQRTMCQLRQFYPRPGSTAQSSYIREDYRQYLLPIESLNEAANVILRSKEFALFFMKMNLEVSNRSL